jgi:hypothetical protein
VKDGILTIEEMTARDRKRYLDCQEHRFREISEMGAKVGEIYAFNPITGEIREVEKK